MIEKLLSDMAAKGGSDLHLRVGKVPFYRIDGDMCPVNTKSIDEGLMQSLVKEVANESRLLSLGSIEGGGAVDFSAEICGKRFRLNIFRESCQLAIVVRSIPTKLFSCEEIGVPEQGINMLGLESGLVLVTGPTGSGKTSTLASMVKHIAEHRRVHIITLEDPVEYRLPCGNGIVSQREIGIDLPNFKDGLRFALRQDPDVILVGEMRDLETMASAISAAETGHLVFATLHTQSAASTISRIVDSFPGSEQATIRTQLSLSLKGAFAQKLVKRIGGGRIAAIEFMSVNTSIQPLIRSGEYHKIPSYMQTGGVKFGMRLMDESLFQLCRDGKICEEEALKYAKDPEELAKRIVKEIRQGSGKD